MLLILVLTSKGMAGVPRASLVVIAATLTSSTFPGRPAAHPGRGHLSRHGPLGHQRGRQLDCQRRRRQVGERADYRRTAQHEAAHGRGGNARAHPIRAGSGDRAAPSSLRCAPVEQAPWKYAGQDDTHTPSTPEAAGITGTGPGACQRQHCAGVSRQLGAVFLPGRAGQPIGYSIELCRRWCAPSRWRCSGPWRSRWVGVTSATRMRAIVSGQADLECGSTTSNLDGRRPSPSRPPSLSPARGCWCRGAGIRDWRDLGA